MVAVVYALCDFVSPVYATFPCGVALAALLPREQNKLPGWAVAALIVAAIYLFGFSDADLGAFVPLARVLKNNVVPADIIASVLVIVAIELAPDTFRKRLSGRLAERLGALSFPLYLIHFPVLCSLGCAVLVSASTWGTYANIIAAAATIIGSVLAAIPLAFFNEYWVRAVNGATARLLSQPSLRRPAAVHASD